MASFTSAAAGSSASPTRRVQRSRNPLCRGKISERERINVRGADPVSARSVSSENGHASEGWWMCATSLVRGEAIFSRHVQKNAVCRAASQELFGQENTLGVHRHAVTIRVSFSVSEIRSSTLTNVGFGKRNPLGVAFAHSALLEFENPLNRRLCPMFSPFTSFHELTRLEGTDKR